MPSEDPEEVIVCGEDHHLAESFQLLTGACPSVLKTTWWEYQYRPAGADFPPNKHVYATYVLYYHTNGGVTALPAQVSIFYSEPTPIVPSGAFSITLSDDLIGAKFLGFSTYGTAVCTSYTSPGECWAAAHALGLSLGYHFEVRYCIVRSTIQSLASFCGNDPFDELAPQMFPQMDASVVQWAPNGEELWLLDATNSLPAGITEFRFTHLYTGSETSSSSPIQYLWTLPVYPVCPEPGGYCPNWRLTVTLANGSVLAKEFVF